MPHQQTKTIPGPARRLIAFRDAAAIVNRNATPYNCSPPDDLISDWIELITILLSPAVKEAHAWAACRSLDAITLKLLSEVDWTLERDPSANLLDSFRKVEESVVLNFQPRSMSAAEAAAAIAIFGFARECGDILDSVFDHFLAPRPAQVDVGHDVWQLADDVTGYADTTGFTKMISILSREHLRLLVLARDARSAALILRDDLDAEGIRPALLALDWVVEHDRRILLDALQAAEADFSSARR